MIWEDILIERQFDYSTLSRALAESFEVPIDQVAVVGSVEEIANRTAVVCVQLAVNGDFECLLSVYVADSLADSNVLTVLARLCSTLKVRALVSDMSANPYTMTLIDMSGEARAASLDVESWNRDEYRLSAESLDDE